MFIIVTAPHLNSFFLWNWRIPLLFTFSLNALYKFFFKLYVFCQEIKTDSADIGQIRRNKKYPQSHPQGFFMVDVYHFSRFLYIHIMLFSTSASNAGLIYCLTWGLAFIAPHAYWNEPLHLRVHKMEVSCEINDAEYSWQFICPKNKVVEICSLFWFTHNFIMGKKFNRSIDWKIHPLFILIECIWSMLDRLSKWCWTVWSCSWSANNT